MEPIIPRSLHRIHETLLHLVEDHDTHGHDDNHEHETIDEPTPAHELAGSEETVFEGLQDGGDGIQAHELMDRDAQELHALGLAERVHDRGRVHPELDQEGEQDLEVAVFGREGRDNSAESESQARDHQDKDREQKGVPVQMCLAGRVHEEIDDVDDDEEPELDAKAKQITDNVGDRYHQPREIHLSEDGGVLHERIGCLGDTVREILPQAGTGEIEQRPRHPVRGNTGDTAEHDHVHDDRKGRLDDVPERSQDGLLVLGDDISLDEQGT